MWVYAEVLPQLDRNMRWDAREIHIRSAFKSDDFAIHERRILIIRDNCPVVILRCHLSETLDVRKCLTPFQYGSNRNSKFLLDNSMGISGAGMANTQ